LRRAASGQASSGASRRAASGELRWGWGGGSGYRGGRRWEEGLAALGVALGVATLGVGHGKFFLRRRVEAQQE